MAPRPGALLWPPVPRGPPVGRTPKVKNVFCFKIDAKSIPEALPTTILILQKFSIDLAHRQNLGVSARPTPSGTPHPHPIRPPSTPPSTPGPQKVRGMQRWGFFFMTSKGNQQTLELVMGGIRHLGLTSAGPTGGGCASGAFLGGTSPYQARAIPGPMDPPSKTRGDCQSDGTR